VASKDPDLVALGAAVRGLRERRGLSQEALADAAKLHRTYVGGVERGERNIGFKNLVTLADALAVPPSELTREYEHARDGGSNSR
jgi:transcriptional regulator with XRE-family HTH domain